MKMMKIHGTKDFSSVLFSFLQPLVFIGTKRTERKYVSNDEIFFLTHSLVVSILGVLVHNNGYGLRNLDLCHLGGILNFDKLKFHLVFEESAKERRPFTLSQKKSP